MADSIDLFDRIHDLVSEYQGEAEDASHLEEAMMWVHRAQGASAAASLIREVIRVRRCSRNSEGAEISCCDLYSERLEDPDESLTEEPLAIRHCNERAKKNCCANKRPRSEQ